MTKKLNFRKEDVVPCWIGYTAAVQMQDRSGAKKEAAREGNMQVSTRTLLAVSHKSADHCL